MSATNLMVVLVPLGSVQTTNLHVTIVEDGKGSTDTAATVATLTTVTDTNRERITLNDNFRLGTGRASTALNDNLSSRIGVVVVVKRRSGRCLRRHGGGY